MEKKRQKESGEAVQQTNFYTYQPIGPADKTISEKAIAMIT